MNEKLKNDLDNALLKRVEDITDKFMHIPPQETRQFIHYNLCELVKYAKEIGEVYRDNKLTN